MSDTVVIDHTLQWLPQGDGAHSTRALVELVPDLTMRIPVVHRLDDHGAVFSTEMEGTDRQGASVAWSVISFVSSEGVTELFPDDQLDPAIERFERPDGR